MDFDFWNCFVGVFCSIGMGFSAYIITVNAIGLFQNWNALRKYHQQRHDYLEDMVKYLKEKTDKLSRKK